MTILNAISLTVFVLLVVGLALAYRWMRAQVRDAEGFVGIREDAQVASSPLLDSQASDEADVVVELGVPRG